MKHITSLLAACLFAHALGSAQTQFKNCHENTVLQNVIVNDAASKEWIGNTDATGTLMIPENVKEIEISHPSFGSVTIPNRKGTICTDEQGEVLNELVIETGDNVTKTLLTLLDHSFSVYKKANKGKKYYEVDYRLAGQNQVLETFRGILALGNVFNSSFNNYTLKWTEAIKDNPSFNKLPRYQYIEHTNEILFADKGVFEKFKKRVQSSKVQHIGNQYFISNNGSEEFVTLDVDATGLLISGYVNTELLNTGKPYAFEKGDKRTMGKVAMTFASGPDAYFAEDLSVEARYLIDGKDYESECFIKQKKLTKEEEKQLKGKGIIGFAVDYTEQLEAYLNSLK